MSLEFSGKQTIPVSTAQVWAYLLNVNKVAGCAPGFQSLEAVGNERWKVIVSAAIGPVKAKFNIDLTRTDMREPERMVVKVRGNAPGTTVEASGTMQLVALTPDSTRMDWTATVDVSGTLAKVGVQLVKGTIEKQAGQFFECLKKNIQASYGRW